MPQDSIELLWNLRKNSRQDLREKGIFTIEQFNALSLEEIAKIKGIKSTASRFKAQAEAYVRKTPVQYGEVHPVMRQKAILFDLETDIHPEAGFHSWCMGWCDCEGNSKIAVVNGQKAKELYSLDRKTEIHIVASPEDAWWCFYHDIVEMDAPIFHWTGYDAGVMRQTAPERVREALLPRMHDFADSFIKAFQLPIKSYSIKEVARYFGFEWQEYDNWQQALWDYRSWLRTGNPRYLMQACGYQRDDVLSMLTVWAWLNEQANS
jgi:predicted RecB family nuclease